MAGRGTSGKPGGRRRPPRPETAARAELRLPVWQFVRLMVQVEETLDAGEDGRAAALARAWSAVWKEIDATLTRLGKADPEGFAELMMDQEVVLEEVSPAQARTAGRELLKVVRAIRAALAEGPKDGRRAEDLRFEIAELEATLKHLPRD